VPLPDTCCGAAEIARIAAAATAAPNGLARLMRSPYQRAASLWLSGQLESGR
jgi:hypothetical protein